MKILNHLRCTKIRKTWLLLAVLGLVMVMTLYHSHFPPEPVREVKVIGYACVEGCGGWADRQKGIVGVFVLATILGKQFKIHMPSPCELSFFLTPRLPEKLDWRVDPEELSRSKVTWLQFMQEQGLEFAEDLLAQDRLSDMFTTDYVFLTFNMEIVHILRKHRLAQKIGWLQEQTIPEIYRTVLTELFALMTGPQHLWNNFWVTVPRHAQLICAQIRVGGSDDTESFNTIQHFKGLASFLAPYNVTSSSSVTSSNSSSVEFRFVFTSDKAFMLEHAHRHFPTLSLNMTGPITHVDRSKVKGVCGGLSRAIVEQLVLSTCHVLVMSESGFSRIAAFLRNTDHNLFLYHDGLVERTCRESPFPNRPSW